VTAFLPSIFPSFFKVGTGVLSMFALAFFDNVLGNRRVVAIVAGLSLWLMVDEIVPWSVQLAARAPHLPHVTQDADLPLGLAPVRFICHFSSKDS
jgi:hypothetical protein